MNKPLPTIETPPKSAHGTVASYVVGFVLSLVFTLIPYYLIVQKSFSGTALLAMIIGFAVLQLVVQVVFFLHLGRDAKSRWNWGFLVATVGAILVVVVGSIFIMDHLHYNMSAIDVTNKIAGDEAVHQVDGKQAGTCSGEGGVDHKIVLKKDAVSPHHTDAHLCDTISITTEGDATRAVMFGTHEQLETYAGETGETVRSGHSKQFVLTEAGLFQFHDHAQPEISGDFTVTP
jgi:cytochrome o ubiquinol oxidase operon protein cyoD